MTTRLRPRARQALDLLIAQGVQPKAARNGVGLVLQSPGTRATTLFNQRGLTPSGKYYYEKKGLSPPTRFDYEQDPERRGRSQYIRLLDGTSKKIATWNANKREWNLTQLGKTFYSKSVDKFIVLWPAKVQLTRINGSIFEKEDYLPSTAIAELGEIEVPRALLEEAQRQKVAQIEAAWRAQRPQIEGETVLLSGYESYILDTSRPITYHKQEVSIAGDVTTTLNRPLREGRPMRFHGFEGVSEDAYAETDGQCVSFQLAKHIRIKGRDASHTQEQIAEMLLHISEELYEESDVYEDCDIIRTGFTAAAMVQLCKELNVPIHVKWQNCKIESFTPEKTQYESIAIHIWADHSYIVGSPLVKKAIAREPIQTPVPHPSEVLAKIGRSTNNTPGSQFWHLFTRLQPGHFYTYDIRQVRNDLLKEGVCAQVRLNGKNEVRGLRYNDCIIHSWPWEAHVCLAFLMEYSKTRHHSLQYRGESLPTFCAMVFDDMCRPCDRPFLTKDMRKELSGKQNGKCALCGDDTLQEIDHKIPRACHGSDSMNNYSFLCAICHREKTQQDHTRMNIEDQNMYTSRFNQETWEGFVKARKPTQNVCNLQDAVNGQVLEVDIRSCRYNGITEGNAHDIPIFSPLDEFTRPIEGRLADYQWCELHVKSALADYIYDGPRWYDKASCEFMLETGLLKWRHIKLAFNATTHRPANDLASKLKKMKKVWFDVGATPQAEAWAGEKAKKKDVKELLAKTAMLNLIGFWGRIENYRHQLICSTHPDDVPWDGPCQSTPTPHSVLHDVSFKQKVLDLASFLPLNLIGRSQERLQMARGLQILQKCCALRRVLSIQVDAIYVDAKRDAKKLQHRFQNIRYNDLHKQTPPVVRAMANVQQTASTSTELVYKANICEGKYPGGTLQIADHVPPPHHEDLKWDTHEEPKEGEDVFLERILEHVADGRAFTCLGPPGTGKTYIVAKVKEALEEKGEKCTCLAPTHAAARLLPDGMTVHHFVGKYAMQGAYKGWILLDEVSMCCVPLLAALDQLRLAGVKICTFGDWDQLPPHPDSNSWRGNPVSATAFQQSRLYRSWSDCTCFQLSRCRRSDAEHFQFYTSLPQSLRQAIARSKRKYQEVEDVDLHVCLSHRRRRAISSHKQSRLAQNQKCVKISACDDFPYMCFVGTRLVGNATNNKIVNGGRYTVTKLGEKIGLKDEATEEEFEVTVEALSKHTLLAHAMVYNKVQGSTEKGSVMLHDTSSKYFRKSHLYVGLSRVIDGSLVHVAND